MPALGRPRASILLFAIFDAAWPMFCGNAKSNFSRVDVMHHNRVANARHLHVGSGFTSPRRSQHAPAYTQNIAEFSHVLNILFTPALTCTSSSFCSYPSVPLWRLDS